MRSPSFLVAAVAACVAIVWACAAEDPVASPTPAADAAPTEDVVVTQPDTAVPPNTLLYTSGTRLRAEVYALDGATLLDGFFDTKRGEGCGYTRTAEAAHCLPPAMTIAYLDAACTQPIAVGLTCDPPVTYAVQGETTGVCVGELRGVAEIRSVGAPLAAPGDVYLRNAGGECNLSSGWSLFFAVGAPIPLAEFVRGTRVRVDLSSSIAAEKIVGDDGSSVVGDLVDRGRDAGCEATSLGPPDSAKDRCVATARGFFDSRRGPFADPGCTEAAAAPVARAGCPAPSGAIRATAIDAGPAECAGFETAFFTLGDPVASGFRRSGNACLPSSELGHFRLGAPVAEDTLPAVPLTRFGSGRLRANARASNGTRVTHGRLWDEQEKSECNLLPFADGKTYCVPSDVALGDQERRFRDAACTQEVVFVGCTPLKYKVSQANPGCANGPQATSVRPLGPVSDVAEYYVLNGTCTGPETFGAGRAQDVLTAVDVATRLPIAPARVRE